MKQYIVDAFTDRVFAGNPAAVCVTEQPLPVPVMGAIARENNLSETAFAVPAGEGYSLRWFTPGGEVDLCGHATLATAFVLFSFFERDADTLTFFTAGGRLTVRRKDGLLEMEFPAYALEKVPVTDEMERAIGSRPLEAYRGRDLLCVMKDAETVRGMQPDQDRVKALDGLLLHVTAAGDGAYDCVSRSFAPKLKIPEDPVCGSGHCHIVPYWAERLGRAELTAFQASARGGTLFCRMAGDRVFLSGKAVLFAEAEIYPEGA